jgi:hypothetical protein
MASGGKVVLQSGSKGGDARPPDPQKGEQPASNKMLRRGSSSSWTKANGSGPG